MAADGSTFSVGLAVGLSTPLDLLRGGDLELLWREDLPADALARALTEWKCVYSPVVCRGPARK